MPAFRNYPPPRDGFCWTFANGRQVSVIWHEGAYSDRGETTAEVMADFEAICGMFPGRFEEYDGVLGHCTPEQVLTIMALVALLPAREGR